MFRSILVAGALAGGLLLNSGVFAQSASNTTLGNTDANPDPVFVFNRICYSQVPSVQAIRDMSVKLAWKPIPEVQLARFKSVDNPTSLDGWDVQVGERLFRVGLQQAPLTDAQRAAFPDLKKGVSTTCSIVLDDQQNASEFMPNMQTLAGKEPVSKDVAEGLLRTTTWAGGNDVLKVFLIAKAPPTGKGGLLNVTILQ